MKTAGLIGGTTWHSTLEYYRIINEAINLRYGGDVSASLILRSLNFNKVNALQITGDWDGLAALLINESNKLALAGADFIAICANTLHKVMPDIENHVDIPIFHIIDALLIQIEKTSFSNLGLLATPYTLKSDFYQSYLASKPELKILIPQENDIAILERIIYKELVRGRVKPASKDELVAVINRLKEQGADSIILGCTELAKIITPSCSPLPLFDTTLIHAASIANKLLKE